MVNSTIFVGVASIRIAWLAWLPIELLVKKTLLFSCEQNGSPNLAGLARLPLELLVKKTLLFSSEHNGSLYIVWLVWLQLKLLEKERVRGDPVWHIVCRNVEVHMCIYASEEKETSLAFSMP